MPTTRLSSKGQVVIPKELRAALHWSAGTTLKIEQDGGALVLRRAEKPKRLPTREELNHVAGILKYDGPAVSIEDMDLAIERMHMERWKK